MSRAGSGGRLSSNKSFKINVVYSLKGSFASTLTRVEMMSKTLECWRGKKSN